MVSVMYIGNFMYKSFVSCVSICDYLKEKMKYVVKQLKLLHIKLPVYPL
jgi:cytochrome oxidase Cu insertion factor (SCO1/SenC/PrrC family)